MTKLEFILALNEKLKDLPQDEARERISFYSEMIEDRMEEGLSEEDAVAAIGSIDEIVAQIKPEKAPSLNKQKRRLRAWEIALLALGSPIWLSLLIAAFAVALSLFIVLWALIICLWAVFAAFVCGAGAGVIAGVIFICSGNELSGIFLFSASAVCAGLAILWFYLSRIATKGSITLTKKIFTIKKEAA